MELLLLGAGVAVITEILKWAFKKWQNKELITAVIYLLTFGLALVGGGVYYYAQKSISPETIEQILSIWATSIGFYELAISRVINPAITKVFGK